MTINGQSGRKPRQRVRLLLFDLDDTLYRCPSIPDAVKKGIEKYMVNNLGFSKEEALSKATELYLKYGTTLAGLQATGHNVASYDDWHAQVHYEHIDYASLLRPDAGLRELLSSMCLPKYVLTNADRKHAAICLERLGIADLFQGVYHFEWLMEAAAKAGKCTAERPVVCKPMSEAYELVLNDLGVDASEVLFADDSTRNIGTAHDLGMLTVLVGQPSLPAGATADFAVRDLHDLPLVLPELFDQPGVVREPPHEHEHMITVAS